MKRVVAYIDGFNLYHSLDALGDDRLKWLDLHKVLRWYLRDDERLEKVVYFTALATWNREKQLRHKRYIRALELHGVKVVYGKFKTKTRVCDSCGTRARLKEEKRTDVNIAVSLLKDAVLDTYDTAILVSGDTDLIPVAQTLHQIASGKRLGVLFPVKRHTSEMDQVVDFSHTITRNALEASRLPDAIKLPSGKMITPPVEWC